MYKKTWRKLKGMACDFHDQLKREDRRTFFLWLGKTLKSLPGNKFEYGIFVMSLDRDISAFKPRSPVTIRLATESDLYLLKGLLLPSQLQELLHLHTHGCVIFIAFDGAHPAGYCWATPRVEITNENLRIRLRPGDIYGGMAYTLPCYRRQGIQTALQYFRLRHLRERGYKRLIAIIEKNNHASIRLHLKVGFTEIDRLFFKRVLWKRIFHYQKDMF